MRYALIDSDSRVVALENVDSPDSWQHPADMQIVEADGFEPEHDLADYEYVDGAFEYVEPAPAPLTPGEVFQVLVSTIMPDVNAANAAVPPETAARMVEWYPEWAVGILYAEGYRVQYEGVLYKVLQAHTSQADWTPDVAVSLYANILIPDPSVIPEWVQPGSTNPYMKGDKVRHNGKIWQSTVDYNVWEPGVYGWEEVED